MKNSLTLFSILLLPFLLKGQSAGPGDSLSVLLPQSSDCRLKPYFLPSLLIGYGCLSLKSDFLKHLDRDIRDEITGNIHHKISIDDFSQYAPALSAYVFNELDIKGKHRFADRTVLLATSFLIQKASVIALKSLTKLERPDHSTRDAFPSGHTATAFSGAELLRLEFKDISIWYGISGYLVAGGTGFLRIYNNRHWFSDVVMGAGMGILSTQLAYYLFPYIQKVYKETGWLTLTTIHPFVMDQNLGVSIRFILP